MSSLLRNIKLIAPSGDPIHKSSTVFFEGQTLVLWSPSKTGGKIWAAFRAAPDHIQVWYGKEKDFKLDYEKHSVYSYTRREFESRAFEKLRNGYGYYTKWHTEDFLKNHV